MVRNQTTVVRTADEDPISETVVLAVAAARDICPTDLETPLAEAIDPDALEHVLAGADHGSDRTPVRVEFTWADCDVTVDGTGRVVVTNSGAPGATESLLLAQ